MDENMRVLPVRKDGKFCYNIILKADFTKLGEQVKTLGVEVGSSVSWRTRRPESFMGKRCGLSF